MSHDYARLARELKGIAYPIRLAALDAIGNGANTKTDIHRILRKQDPTMSLQVLAYHVDRMRGAGLIELEYEERVRGALQKHYALTERGRAMLDFLMP